MNSHEQAIQELMEFGWRREEAEQMIALEEVGFVFDPISGKILNVDPDLPIPWLLIKKEDQTAQWN